MLAISTGFAQPASGKTGKIIGKVVNSETGDVVIGANVSIKGTARGAATDLDGKYAIHNITPGTYAVVISYISYGKKIITGVQVHSGATVKVNVALTSKTIEGKGVTVTAEANASSEAGLLSVQQKSVSVQDGISSEQISKTGDSDVGETMKRVTGVTVENGKNIFVRGLGNRYSNIQLNGAQLPSTDPNKKEVPADLIGNGLIENIKVQKTYSVDQMADFSGGSVKIDTKEFPYQRSLSLSYATQYNTVGTSGNIVSGGINSSTDFLGYDNGTRSLPSLIKNKRVNGNNAGSVAQAFNNSWNLNRELSNLPSQSIGISYANQFNQDKMPIGVVSNFSYKYNRKKEPDKTERFLQGYNSNNEADNQSFLTDYTKNQGIEEANLKGMVNIYIKPSSKTKFGLKNLYSNSLNNSATLVQGKYLNGITRQTVKDFDRRSIISSTFEGKTYFEHFLKSSLSGHISYNRALRTHPDRRTTRYNKVSDTGKEQYQFQAFGDNNGHYYSNQRDNNYGSEVNYKINPANFISVSTGGNFMIKARNFKARRISYRDQVAPFLPKNLKFKPPGTVLNARNVKGTGGKGYLELTETTQFNHDWYKGYQKIYAGYLKSKLNPIEDFSIGLGLRMENSSQTIKVPKNIGSEYHEVARVDNHDFLPAVNVKYSLNSKTNVRVAYSRTLARPSFREISNFSFADYQGGRRIYGNPDLKQTNITNYDFRIETYPGEAQMFSLGLFYKHFKNPIELFYRLVDANEVFYNNAPEARLYGLEIEGRKKITNRLRLYANATYIYSQSRMDSSSINRVANLKRPMTGQSPYVGNLSAFYDLPNWNMNFSLNFNTYGKRIVTVGKNAQQFDEYEQPFNTLGAKIHYSIGRYNINLQANNILNDTHIYKVGPVTTYRYKPGIDFKLGVKVKL